MKKILPILVVSLALLLTVVSAGCLTTEISLVFHVDGYQDPWDEITFDGKTLNLPSNPPEKDGYEFKGWYFDKGTWKEPVSINGIQDMSLQKTIDIYAYYAPKNSSDYKVVFVSGTNDVQSAIYKNGLIQEPTAPVKENYIFDGWYRSQNFYPEDKWIFDTDSIYNYSDKDNTVTLYANWKPYHEANNVQDGYKVVTTGYPKIGAITFIKKKSPQKGAVVVQYLLGKVDSAYITTIAKYPFKYSGGDATLSLVNSKDLAEGIEEGLTKIASQSFGLENSNTVGIGATAGDAVTVGAEATVDLGVVSATGSVDKTLSLEVRSDVSTTVGSKYQNSRETQESLSRSSSQSSGESFELSLNLKGYPEGYYRIALREDCLVVETVVYDLDTNSVTIYNSVHVPTNAEPTYRLEYSADGSFEIPSTTEKRYVSPEDLSIIYKVDRDGNYIMSTAADLLLVPISKSSDKFILSNDIDLSEYSWFDYTPYLSRIDKNGHSIFPDTTATYTSDNDNTTVESTSYSVKFDSNGGNSIGLQTVLKGNTVIKPIDPTKSGYTFDDWYTSSSYTTKWDFNTPVTKDMVLYAKWTAPVGNTESPIEISSAKEFMKIYNKPSLHYKLIADIDLTGYSIPTDVNFSGSLDGNGHTITGNTNGLNSISIDSTKLSSTKYFGLFSTNSGTIKNLKLVNFGVVGADQDYVNIGDKTQAAYFGCLAGLNTGTISGVTLTDCNMNDGRMWGGCGLIVGLNKGTISDCTINGGHLTADCDVGGLAGGNEGSIRSCSIYGTGSEFIKFLENSWVIHTGYNGRAIGGIVGWSSPGSSVIDSCSVSDITITCEYRVDKCYLGSIAGSNAGRISDCTAAGVSPYMEKCGANSGTII